MSLHPELPLPDDPAPDPLRGLRTFVQSTLDSTKETVAELKELPAFAQSSWAYYRSHPLTFGIEVLSGVSLSVVMATEAIAFAVLANMAPISGLYSCFFMGVIAGLLTGRPPIISGAAGAIAIAVAELTSAGGPLSHLSLSERREHLFMAMLFCGVFQAAIGLLRLGRLVRLIPRTTMIGFLNGLAVVIFMSQLPTFQRCTDPAGPLFEECPTQYKVYMSLADGATWMCIINVLLSVAVINFFPRVPRAGKIIPATLVTLLVGSFFEHVFARVIFNRPTRTVGESAPLAGSLPSFHWPSIPNTSTSWGPVLQYAFFAAAVGLIESILTAQAMAELLHEPLREKDVSREVAAQALGNVASSLFGGMGGNAMVGESILNYNSGARNRLSMFVCGWMVLFIVLALNVAVNEVPMATIAGVIFGIAIHTFHWPSLLMLHRVRPSDAFCIVAVSLAAVFLSLTIAVGIGLALSALVFVLDSAAQFTVTPAHLAPQQWASLRTALAAGSLGSIKQAELWAGRRGVSAATGALSPGFADSASLDSSGETGTAAADGVDSLSALQTVGLRAGPGALRDASLTAGLARDFNGNDNGNGGGNGDSDGSHSAEHSTRRRDAMLNNAQKNTGDDDEEDGQHQLDYNAVSSSRAGAGNGYTAQAHSHTVHDLSISVTNNSSNADVNAHQLDPTDRASTVKLYFVDGGLFFGSSYLLLDKFTPVRDPLQVVLDLSDCVVGDYTAAAELTRLLQRYAAAGAAVALVGVSAKTRRQLLRAREFCAMHKTPLAHAGWEFPAPTSASATATAGAGAEAAVGDASTEVSVSPMDPGRE